MGAEPSAEIRRFAHIQCASVLVEQRVHAGRGRGSLADCVARSTPDFPPVFNDKRLFDKATRQLAPRPADAQHFERKAWVIWRVIQFSHFSEPRQECVSDHVSSLS
jgi:hypothetical protein